MYKTPANPVSDNTIFIVENELDKYNKFTLQDTTIIVKTEKVDVIYNCDDEAEIKDFKEQGDIKHINELEVILDGQIETYEVIFNDELMNALTSNEAAKQYGITGGTLRSAMKSEKLRFGSDYRKAGRITLINRYDMERE